jgi:hypothetical protein
MRLNGYPKQCRQRKCSEHSDNEMNADSAFLICTKRSDIDATETEFDVVLNRIVSAEAIRQSSPPGALFIGCVEIDVCSAAREEGGLRPGGSSSGVASYICISERVHFSGAPWLSLLLLHRMKGKMTSTCVANMRQLRFRLVYCDVAQWAIP